MSNLKLICCAITGSIMTSSSRAFYNLRFFFAFDSNKLNVFGACHVISSRCNTSFLLLRHNNFLQFEASDQSRAPPIRSFRFFSHVSDDL